MLAPDRRHRQVIAAGFALSAVASLGLFGPYQSFSGAPRLEAAITLFFLPATAAVIAATLRQLQRMPLTHRDYAAVGDAAGGHHHRQDVAADAALNGILFWLVLFVIGVHALVVSVLVGAVWTRPWGGRAVLVLIGVTAVAVGNLLPRTRPNAVVGIRTARTLADRRVWMMAHRTTGYLAVAGGAVTIYAALALDWGAVTRFAAATLLVTVVGTSAGYWRATRRLDSAKSS